MVSYVAAGSSISTIDFAAGLFAYKIFKNCKIHILLNEFPELPTNTSVRHLVSRASLPICNWSQDSRGTWRQHFIPLEFIRTKNDFSLSLIKSVETYKRHLLLAGNEYQTHRIEKRIDKAIKSMASVRFCNWADWSLLLSEYIYHAVANQQIKAQPELVW